VRVLRQRIALLTLLALSLSDVTIAAAKPYVVLVPVFLVRSTDRTPSQAERLGNKVATVINLQLWLTLRRPPENELRDRPGEGEVTWDSDSLPPRTANQADDLARAYTPEAFMTVWGNVDAVGDDVYINPRLSIRNDGAGEDLWDNFWVVKSPKDQSVLLRATPPNARYEFLPIPVRRSVIGDLITPGGLPLYDPATSEQLGTAGDYFRREYSFKGQGYEAAIVKIPGRSKEAMVKVPTFTNEPTELVSFTSGVLRLFRHDWKYACENFLEVTRVKWVTPPVRRDVDAYMSMCLSKMGNITEAIQLASHASSRPPFTFERYQYWAMSVAEAFSRSTSTEEKAKYETELRRIREQYLNTAASSRHNFEWLDDLDSFLN
jgi:hypothetical protein